MVYGEVFGSQVYGGMAPIKPSPIPKIQAEQLRQLRKELPPPLLRRWGATIDVIADGLGGRGRKAKGAKAVAYIRARRAEGRKLTHALKEAAARHAKCSRRTVNEWLQKTGEN